MALIINRREKAGIPILELTGRLVFGQDCDALRDQIKQLLAANKSKIILNLEYLTYCDSSGLGCLTNMFVSSRNRGGALKLVKPSKRVQEALDITRLNTFMEVYTDTDEAMASFNLRSRVTTP